MDKSDSERQFAQAKAHFREGRHAEALAMLDDMILAYPHAPRLAYARALCLQSLGRVEEAITTCEHALAHSDHERTRALLGQLRAAPPPLQAARRIPWVPAAAGLAVLAAVAGVALWLPASREVTAPATLEDSIARRNTEVRVPAEGGHGEFQGVVLPPLQAHSDDAPRAVEHAPETWRSLALAGVPLTEPGIYYHVPSLTREHFVFNYYLPRAYAEEPLLPMPWLVITHAGGGGHFLGLEDWAESRGVVLMVFNESGGRSHARNAQVQDAGLYTAIELLRLDTARGMAIGVSAGARTNWNMVNRYADHFAGIVMIAFPAGDSGPTPQHIRIAFINGTNDFNASGVHRWVPRLRQLGRDVEHYEFPGGHEPGPVDLRIQALDWVMRRARKRAVGAFARTGRRSSHSGLHPTLRSRPAAL